MKFQESLIACDGAILLVDATQGIQAQTFAHSYAAIEAGLEVIPVLNKIDSIDADKESAKKMIDFSNILVMTYAF